MHATNNNHLARLKYMVPANSELDTPVATHFNFIAKCYNKSLK